MSKSKSYYLDPDALDEVGNDPNAQDLLSEDPAYQKFMNDTETTVETMEASNEYNRATKSPF